MATIITKILNFIVKFKWLFILIIIIIVGVFYKITNPYEVNYLPKCTFYTITGYQCPGCGSQRALHDILNLNFISALKENFLLVISLPYIFFGAFLDLKKKKSAKLKKIQNIFYENNALIVIFFIIIFFWIFRNFKFYHQLF